MEEKRIIDPHELDRFLAGDLGNVLKVSIDGREEVIVFELKGPTDVIARIPRNGGRANDSFRIEQALSYPACAAEFSLSASEYVVRITKRHQVRSVMKIAFNHLNWTNLDRIRLSWEAGRVAPGDCSPGAPTEPDVQVSRIRFLK